MVREMVRSGEVYIYDGFQNNPHSFSIAVKEEVGFIYHSFVCDTYQNTFKIQDAGQTKGQMYADRISAKHQANSPYMSMTTTKLVETVASLYNL